MLRLLFLAFTGLTASALPYSRTPATQLEPPGLEHHEVLRIGRDFGKEEFKVVIDSWTTRKAPGEIDEVRFWWVDGSKQDERSPFGRKLRKYIGMQFIHNSPDDWTVKLRGDKKEFSFDVELDDRTGRIAAYGDIRTRDGVLVEHCRATDGEFVARRIGSSGFPSG